jgi:replicative DNA helicase
MEKMKMPYNKELEETVIGALLTNSDAAIEVMPILKDAKIFFDPKMQKIFKAIVAIYNANDKIDMLTVDDKLKSLKLDVSTYDLVLICNKTGSSAHLEYHCRLLLQYYIKRSIIKKSQRNIQLAMDESTDSLELLNTDAKGNDDINEIVFSGRKTKSYAESLQDNLRRVEMLSNADEVNLTGVPTGFKILDNFTGGWQPSDLIIIAARPGMGKTSFVLKTTLECGIRNIPCAFFSLEMSSNQLSARTIANNSNFHLSQLIRKGFEKPEYFNTLSSKIDKMKDFPIYIEDTPSMDIRDIVSKARIMKRKHDIKILIVDYIQLIVDKTKANNREQEISSITRNLKLIAKELNIPVIALSQLNRSVETRTDKHPKLSDLRESGAIEQDADIVTFLYRHEYYYPDSPLDDWLVNKGANAEFSFAKYREGSLKTIGLHFDGNKVKYSDPQEHDEYADDIPKMNPNDDNIF